MDFQIKKHTLQFKFTAGTSRGSFTEKETWFIKLFDAKKSPLFGIGECSPLKGLSEDYSPDYESNLRTICETIFDEIDDPITHMGSAIQRIPPEFPSIRFGIETALRDLKNGGRRKIFPCDFYDKQKSIPINGLVWMGEKDFMMSQIREKLENGFKTIKIKVGAIDHGVERDMLKFIRSKFGSDAVEIRLDANGAYSKADVYQRLADFATFHIHSIEQPVKQRQWELMAEICAKSSIPIALDEELIGVYTQAEKEELLNTIKPQYIILKPSLVGGLEASEEWIKLAENRKIGWWMTSLLESNVGLNAIAQFTSKMRATLPQGLGTGQLYHNNIPSPLVVEEGFLKYRDGGEWDLISL